MAVGLAALALVPVLAALGALEHAWLPLAGFALFGAGYLRWLGTGESPRRMRAGVALLFGLVHGFGFAGVLVDAQLEGGALVAALLAFNLGVELGQLAVLALLVLLLAAVPVERRRGLVLEVASACALGLACLWLGARAGG